MKQAIVVVLLLCLVGCGRTTPPTSDLVCEEVDGFFNCLHEKLKQVTSTVLDESTSGLVINQCLLKQNKVIENNNHLLTKKYFQPSCMKQVENDPDIVSMAPKDATGVITAEAVTPAKKKKIQEAMLTKLIACMKENTKMKLQCK